MRRFTVYLILLLIAEYPGQSFSGVVKVSDPVDSPAMMISNPARCVLLDIARAGERLVAVGEHGVVILSDDQGCSWRQINAPTNVTLTRVKFLTSTCGWIIGHSGIVLHTEDSGETWTRQLDGRAAATLALEAAQANVDRTPNDESARKQLQAAQLLVSDGPDKPFLDLYFENDKTGFVVGAYGLIFRTEDGGKTWQSWMDHIENSKGSHLYIIQPVEGNLYISGEQGLFLRSEDNGLKFNRIETPYGGTFFTLVVARSGAIVLAGLRGNLYWTSNQGKTFKKGDVPIPATLCASAVIDDDVLIFANQAGSLLRSQDQGQTLQLLDVPPMQPVAAMIALENSRILVTAGLGGITRVTLHEADQKVETGGAK